MTIACGSKKHERGYTKKLFLFSLLIFLVAVCMTACASNNDRTVSEKKVSFYDGDSLICVLPADNADVISYVPVKEGYKFGGWYTDAELTEKADKVILSQSGNIALYAKWSIAEYSVKFLDKDGKLIETQLVKHGDHAVSPTPPTVDGFTFDKWGAEFDNVTKDLTVTAMYCAIVSTFKAFYGEEEIFSSEVTAGENLSAYLNTAQTELVIPSGFDFACWSKSSDATETITSNDDMPTNALFVYAVFELSPLQSSDLVISSAKQSVFGEAVPAFTLQLAAGSDNSANGITYAYSWKLNGKSVSCSANEYSVGILDAGTHNIVGIVTATCGSMTSVSAEVKTSLTVTLAVLSGVSVSGVDCIYDGNPHSVSVEGLSDGDKVYYSDSENGTYSAVNPSFVDSEVNTVYCKVVRANYQNYYCSANCKIEKAPLIIIANDKNAVYGGQIPAFDYIASGYVLDEDNTVLDGTAIFRCDAADTFAIGAYQIYVSGLSANNYSISFHTGLLTVGVARLTVTAKNCSTTYGTTAPEFEVEYDGFAQGENENVLSGILTFICNYDSGDDVGKYSVMPCGVSAANYNVIFVAAELIVNKKAVTVSADAKAMTYGEALPELTAFEAGVLDGDMLSYSVECSYKSGDDAGEYEIVIVGGNNSNYEIDTNKACLTVNKKSVTLTVDNKKITYGAAAPVYTAKFSGLLDGDILDGYILNCGYAVGNAVGNYDIVVQLPSNGYKNYTVVTAAATLAVEKKAATVIVDDINIIYGDARPTYTAGVGGIVNGDTLVYTLTCEYVQGDNAATYCISVVFNPSNNPNYEITVTDASLTVGKRSVTLTADDKTAVYGVNAPAFTYQTGILYSDDSLTGIILTADYAAGYGTGDYDICIDVPEHVNYSFVTGKGTLSITNRTVNIALSTMMAYDGSCWSSNAYSASNLYGEDTLTGTLSTISSEVGTYSCTGSTLQNFTWTNFAINNSSGSVANYYDITYAISVEIKLVEIQHSTSTYSGVYDRNSHVATVTSSETGVQILYSSDGETYSETPIAYTNAGSYKVYYKLLKDGKSPALGELDIDITAKPIEVKADDKTSVYGGTRPSFTYTVTGLISGDEIAFSVGCASTSVNVGNYDIAVTGGSSSNYDITRVNGKYSITPKALTVSATDKEVHYGDEAPTYGVSFSGFVYEDTYSSLSGSPTFHCSYTQGNDAGTYQIKVSGYTSSNYSISFVAGTLCVEQLAISLKAVDKTVMYGDPCPTFNANSDGFICGDSMANVSELTYSTDYSVGNGIGNYTITVLTATAQNYSLTFTTGVLTVSKRQTTLTIDDKSVSYKDPAPTYTATANNLYSEDLLDYTLKCSYALGSNVGTYKIEAELGTNVNYLITSVDGVLTVNVKSVAVVWSGLTESYIYNGSNQGSSIVATFDGLTANIAFSGAGTSFINAGNYTITASTANANYSLTSTTESVSMGKANYSTVSSLSYEGVFSPTTTLKVGFPLPGGYSWNSPNSIPSVTTTSYSATYNADSANYYNYSLNLTVVLSKATAELTGETIQSFNYDGTAKSLDVSKLTATYGGSSIATSYSFTTGANSFTAGGTYAVSVDLTADNYAFATAINGYVKVKSVAINSATYTIEDALNSSSSGNTICLTSNAVFATGKNAGCYSGSGYYTIKSGVTLLLESSEDSSTTIGTPTYGAGKTTYVDTNSTYIQYKLTIPSTVTLTTDGNIIIQGLLGVTGGIREGHTSGMHSQIINDGLIVLNNSSKLDCRGYIKGTGNVTINNGSVVYSPFVILDFRGGTNTVTVYKKGEISPFSQYELPNIQCGYVLYYGAEYKTYMDLYAKNQHNSTIVTYIGTSSGLLKLASGARVEKEYNASTSKSTVMLVGSITLGDLSINVKVGLTSTTIAFSSVIFPIPWQYDITIGDGVTATTVTAGYSYKLMPGASITVAKNATLNVTGSLIVYKSFTDTVFGGISYNNTTPARLTVNGTLKVSGTVGGEIKSTENGGKVILSSAGLSMTSVEGNSGSTTSTQALFLLGEFITVATITESATLVNNDGTTLSPSSTATYVYTNGIWIKQ